MPSPLLLPWALPASVPLSDTEERAFLQSRIALFYRVGFVLGAAQMAVAAVLLAIGGTTGTTRHALGDNDWLYPWVLECLATATCMVLWRITRRGARSTGSLFAIDAGGTLLVSAAMIAIQWDQPPYLRADLHALLMVALLLAVRAVFVPSAAARTFAIGLLSSGGVAGFAYSFYVHHPVVAEGAPSAGMFATVDTVTALTWVAVTTFTSRTLYGLRQRVRVATQLGQYTLTEKIGEGGMGIVYKAQHAMLRRSTAVKLLPTDKTGAQDVARFEREVQLTSMLTHPNTIQIYDYGRTPDGTFYYAMEYLDGVTLQGLIELDGPQPPARVIALLTQACGSLAEAHAMGLIHRDIKPANILLCERGNLADVVKVLDFGLVKVLGDAAGGNVSRAGALAGTPLYMAPESITSPDRVDARADLYALGAVGYFLITGREVFEGETVVEICAHHLHTAPQPPSSRLGSPIPADLESVLLSCLAKSPDERPQNAEFLSARLQQCEDAGLWAHEESRRWWRSNGPRLRAGRGAHVAVSGTIGRMREASGARSVPGRPSSSASTGKRNVAARY